MRQIHTPPPDSVDPIETCFPLETDGFDRESGRRLSVADRLQYAMIDFEVPEEARPTFRSLKSHSDRFDAAYRVCEVIIGSSRRPDLQDALVFFDEDEPALYLYDGGTNP